MRIKALIALVAFTSSVAMAQKGVEDGSRFGHGQDSIDCLNNLSLYSSYLKTKSYSDAYTYWKKVFADAPVSQHGIYTNGVVILKNLIAASKDVAERKVYAEEMMAVYDQQLQYLEQLNQLRKSPWTDFYVKGEKAHSYITYYPGMDNDKAYEMLQEVVESGKSNNQYYVISDFMKVSQAKYKKDDAHREEYIQIYTKMAQAVKECQQPEGYWTRSMLDKDHAPGPETSGTAFFTYGLLWGINNGLLDKAEYWPTVEKAWTYLTTVALQPDGRVGYVQPIGERAIPGQIVDMNSTANFGVGAFLLAACEMVRYIDAR